MTWGNYFGTVQGTGSRLPQPVANMNNAQYIRVSGMTFGIYTKDRRIFTLTHQQNDDAILTEIPQSKGALGLATNFTALCFIGANTGVKCMGSNYNGQLGDNTNIDSQTPVDVQNLSNVTQLYSGSGTVCAVTKEDAIWCWGGGKSGQLGNGTQDNVNHPVRVKLDLSYHMP